MKYSILILLLVFTTLPSIAAGEKYNSRDCLHAVYKTDIHHEGVFFGLIKNDLKIQKDKCIMKISFKNLLETTWEVDVCREPIHMKVKSKGSESVYKRDADCSGSSNQSSYCEYRKELNEKLQDFGLIFAKGERESLKDNHGQVYCTYLLVNKYLDKAVLFSKYENPKSIFDTKQESCDLEPSQKVQSPKAADLTFQNERVKKEVKSHIEPVVPVEEIKTEDSVEQF